MQSKFKLDESAMVFLEVLEQAVIHHWISDKEAQCLVDETKWYPTGIWIPKHMSPIVEKLQMMDHEETIH